MPERAVSVENIKAAVFTVSVDESVFIDYGGVNAPLEAIRVSVGSASQSAVRIALAAISRGVFVLPFRLQVRIQPGYVIGSVRQRCTDRASRVGAVEPNAAVMIILDDN